MRPAQLPLLPLTLASDDGWLVELWLPLSNHRIVDADCEVRARRHTLGNVSC